MLKTAIDRRNKDAVMGLGEHLEELRKRVMLAVLAVVPIFIICLIAGKRLTQLAILPASEALHRQGEAINYQLNNPLEGFGAFVKVAAIITIAIAGPWIIYQGWKFIAPGLYKRERRFAYVFAPFSTFMMLAGLAFAYFVVIPIMLKFLLAFNGELLDRPILIKPLPQGVTLTATLPILDADPPTPPVGSEWINTALMERRICIGVKEDKTLDIVSSPLSHSGTIAQQFRLKETLDLIVMTCLATIAGFQTPVVVLLLGWAGLVTPKGLSKVRKYAIAVCAVLGAILTPSPDPFSMMVIAVPMYLLYELGILLIILFPARRILGEKSDTSSDSTSGSIPPADGEGGGP